MEAARNILIDAGYILQEKQPIVTDQLYIKIQPDIETGNFTFVATKFTKEARQKKYRYEKATSNDLNFEFPGNSWNKQETIQTEFSGFVLPVIKPIQPVKFQPVVTTAGKIEGEFEIVNYSEKAIALFGPTKPIKHLFANIGRFNNFLTYKGQKTPGWIFPKNKEAQVRELIGLQK